MNMPKVLDLGQCDHDHGLLKRLIENCGATIERAATEQEARSKLETSKYNLVLINRMLDADNSFGVEIVKRLKAEPQFKALPVMLVSNFAAAQRDAMAAGALEGFGKDHLADPAIRSKITTALKSSQQA